MNAPQVNCGGEPTCNNFADRTVSSTDMRSIQKYFVVFLLLLTATTSAQDEALEFVSGKQRVTLVELYTSEGCSSCPPADEWMSRLKLDPDLWQTIVPVAFHVDYWDYIGWKDRFSSPAYSERQKNYVDEGAIRFAYTPGLFRNGEEWRVQRNSRYSAGEAESAGSLLLRIEGDDFVAQFAVPGARQNELKLTVAVLGMNLETKVRAGENKGRTLYHDFVVLGLETVKLALADDLYVATGEVPQVALDAPDQAIVAWVSRSDRQAPIQSVGGYLKNL